MLTWRLLRPSVAAKSVTKASDASVSKMTSTSRIALAFSLNRGNPMDGSRMFYGTSSKRQRMDECVWCTMERESKMKKPLLVENMSANAKTNSADNQISELEADDFFAGIFDDYGERHQERQSKLLESHHGKDTGIVIDHEEPVNSLAELELSWIQENDVNRSAFRHVETNPLSLHPSDRNANNPGDEYRREADPASSGKDQHPSDYNANNPGEEYRRETDPASGTEGRHPSDRNANNPGNEYRCESLPTSSGEGRHPSNRNANNPGDEYRRETDPASSGSEGRVADETPPTEIRTVNHPHEKMGVGIWNDAFYRNGGEIPPRGKDETETNNGGTRRYQQRLFLSAIPIFAAIAGFFYYFSSPKDDVCDEGRRRTRKR